MIIVTEKNIWMRQGDSGQVVFGGLPTDKAYSVYQALINPDTGKIVKEFTALNFNQNTGEATFIYAPSATDDIPPAEYNYALKICFEQQEDTLIPEIVIQDGYVIEQAAPIFIVAEKCVEGLTNDD